MGYGDSLLSTAEVSPTETSVEPASEDDLASSHPTSLTSGGNMKMNLEDVLSREQEKMRNEAIRRMISGEDEEEADCEDYPSRYELYVPPPPPDLTEREIQALKDEVKSAARQCEILIGRIVRERQRKAQYELRMQNIRDLKAAGCDGREARIIASDLAYWQNKVEEARESVKFIVANWQQFKDDLTSYVSLLEQAWGDGGLLAWATSTICEFIEGRDPPGNLFRDFHSHREEMKHLRASFFKNPRNPDATNKALRAAMESSLEKIQRSLIEFRKLLNE